MIAALRAFLRAWRPREATPAEWTRESCHELNCTARQAAECGYRRAVVDAAESYGCGRNYMVVG